MRDSLGRLISTCERSRNQRECPLLDALEEHNETGKDIHE
jgi:hypothetical protein